VSPKKNGEDGTGKMSSPLKGEALVLLTQRTAPATNRNTIAGVHVDLRLFLSMLNSSASLLAVQKRYIGIGGAALKLVISISFR
jgi:hypothetical protein